MGNKSKIKKPNFFIIGAPRSGTTSLYMYLKSHPQVFFNDTARHFFAKKEPNFFCTDFSNKMRKVVDKKKYLKLFEGANQFRAVGEASTWYLFSKEAIPRINVFNPDAKFIAIVRNPIDVVYSSFLTARYYLNENVRSFKKSWHLQDKRKEGKSIPRWCRDPKLLQWGKIAKTGEQIERLLHFVPREKVKIIVFDDFINNTKKVYKEVLDFLDLEYKGKKDFPVYNKKRNIRFTFVGFILNKLYQYNNKINWRKFFQWNIIKKYKYDLDPNFRKELKKYFKKDVQILSKILNRDLTHWLD